MSIFSRKNGAIAASILVILAMTYFTMAFDYESKPSEFLGSNTEPTFLDIERAKVSAKTFAINKYPNLRFVVADCSKKLTDVNFYCPVEMETTEGALRLITVKCPFESKHGEGCFDEPL